MRIAVTVLLAIVVYTAAFAGTWAMNRRIQLGDNAPAAVAWSVRVVVFVSIMFVVSMPLGLIVRAVG